MEHVIDKTLLQKRVQVHLIGVGGNGAQIAACLARLDIAMKELGHPYGLHVKAFDADRVSEANVGRQLYSRADIGRLKSVITINRLNQFYGLDWEAYPCRYEEHVGNSYRSENGDITISCVDTRSARRTLHHLLSGSYDNPYYWLDLGNREAQAQAILGQPHCAYRQPQDDAPRLPCVTELFPDLLDENIADDNQPSCSMRMSLASQGLFVNDIIVRFASHMLYELFSKGRIAQHGVLVNLDSKRSAPIDIDTATWKRFGYQPEDGAGMEKSKQRQAA